MFESQPEEIGPCGALVVICRRPAIGVGKRRIAEHLGDFATADLAEHLLATALEDAQDWPGHVVLSPSSDADVDWAAGLLSRRVRVIPQPDDGNLGQRILRVDQEVRATGATSVFYVGSDAPLLDARYFEDARTALEYRDVVLGPAADGGVTLMGSRRAWPADLRHLPWGTAELGKALEASCRYAGYSVTLLGERSDVDVVADLPRLCAELEGDERPARRRLHEWLSARTNALTTISIVIPVLGDVVELRRLLDLLGRQHGVEIIVVDGQGDPVCRELCQQQHCTYVATHPGRGHQLRLGAERASGSILWFLHADSEPPGGAVASLRAAVRQGASGGCLRFRFDGPRTPGKRLLECFIALRNRLGGIPYGDQGLFFTRQAYEAAGGFADQPLFEEVPLVRKVRRVPKVRQRASFVVLPDVIAVSSRRWERDGWLRRTVENRLLALGYMVGISPRILARRYRAAREQRESEQR